MPQQRINEAAPKVATLPPIRTDERVLFVGSTGSGKTTLAYVMAKGAKRLVVFDPKSTLGRKAEWGLEDWEDPEDPKIIKKLEDPTKPIRLRIQDPITQDKVKAYDVYCAILYSIAQETYKAGGQNRLLVYIDEANGVTPPGKKPGSYYHGLYTRGRELGIGVWTATQRPYSIPVVCLSESEYYFAFNLRMEEDKKRVAAYMGQEIMNGVRDEHGFWFYAPKMKNPVYFRGISLRKGKGNV